MQKNIYLTSQHVDLTIEHVCSSRSAGAVEIRREGLSR